MKAFSKRALEAVSRICKVDNFAVFIAIICLIPFTIYVFIDPYGISQEAFKSLEYYRASAKTILLASAVWEFIVTCLVILVLVSGSLKSYRAKRIFIFLAVVSIKSNINQACDIAGIESQIFTNTGLTYAMWFELCFYLSGFFGLKHFLKTLGKY